MKKAFHVAGQVTRDITGHGDTPLDAIKDFHHKGGTVPDWAWEGPDTDNGRGVVDLCENCGLPIYEGEHHLTDSDGISWHATPCTTGEP